MIQNWDFNMSINSAINVLEEYNLSNQEYKDIILSYHIQRILKQNHTSIPLKVFEEQPNISEQSSIIQNKFSKLREKFNEIYYGLNSTIQRGLKEAQNIFQDVESNNIPIINDYIKKINQQIQEIGRILQNSRKESQKEEFEQFINLVSTFNYQNKRLQEIEEKLLIQKNQFEKQSQQIENYQKEFQDRFMAILKEE